MNILFTNSGRRTYLIKYALEIAKTHDSMQIFVSDASTDTATFYVDSNITSIITPFVGNQPDIYINALLKECIKHKIDLIIPLMDFELLPLAINRHRFEAIGTKVIISNPYIVERLMDKRLTAEFCKEHFIPYPSLLSRDDNIQFPVIVKRALGSGSVGLSVANCMEELSILYEEDRDVIQTIVNGVEYGMDILNDFDGSYIHSCSRRKISMRAGETDKAETLYCESHEEWARKISKATKHVGNLDVDFFETEQGDLFFIDFNPRFGGGYPFTHLSGFNYLHALIQISGGGQPDLNVVVPQYGRAYKGIDVILGGFQKP